MPVLVTQALPADFAAGYVYVTLRVCECCVYLVRCADCFKELARRFVLVVVRYRVTSRYTIAHYDRSLSSISPSALYHPLNTVYIPFVIILPYIWCISTLYSVLPFGSHTSSLWSGIVLVSMVFPLVPYVPPYTVYYPLALTHPPFGRA